VSLKQNHGPSAGGPHSPPLLVLVLLLVLLLGLLLGLLLSASGLRWRMYE
jgi:hypothetical protein